MRLIGSIADQGQARLFADFLLARGIENQLDADGGGAWGVWVREEQSVSEAQELLRRFQEDPERDVFRSAAREAPERLREQERQRARRRNVYVDARTQIFGRPVRLRLGWFATAVLLASVVLTLHWSFGDPAFYRRWFLLTLPELARGEVWRLFSSTLLHASLAGGGPGVLHLLFNLLWWRDLAGAIEQHQGTRRLVVLYLGLAAFSGLAQSWWDAPAIGLSGVIYGLLGYVWAQGRYRVGSPLSVGRQTMILMLAWALLCLTGALGSIGNVAHFSGLALGAAWGWLATPAPRAWLRRLRR